MSAAHVITVV